MPHSEQQSIIIIVLVADHPAKINMGIQLVSKCQCNIEDSCMAIFGKQFFFIMMLSDSRQSISLIEAMLLKRDTELKLLSIMQKTTSGVYKEYFSIIIANVIVNVAPAIVEQFTCLFITNNFNPSQTGCKNTTSDKQI
ncbi:Glycine cleavage system transcriptional repressor [Arsenophonus endosymbiont of Aleurodicus floccissimus]|uniref:ACT domain-containing protein n=1 Tax=Arsenophonus endosymbiont of Aleurodicus floccissimus TaxID=2152761 RepID=UPI000EECC863|nr:ACT domain-containing protein [Arsenophonus endosymbiont of Aleurodicus floccissimus]SPP31268.1 Glycine cleavage system transcriptional repressor [Arsenophonus endosymbiont of Aleurodicus floccissimus]